mgnify:CR=1 FL=1
MEVEEACEIFNKYFDRYCEYYSASIGSHYSKPCLLISYDCGSGGFKLYVDNLSQETIYIRLYDIVNNYRKV